MEEPYLEALGDDGGLVTLASRQMLVEGVDEPGPELQDIPLLLYGEPLVAAAHHRLHELVGAHLQITPRPPQAYAYYKNNR